MLRMNNETAVRLHPFPQETVEKRMHDLLKTGNSQTDGILDYLLQTRGKMLRPRLVYLTASLDSADPAMVRDAAVSVELIHMASLVHDDVIDNAATRRGKPSINANWGNHTSVLAGDFLFATAFNLINQHNMKEVLNVITQTIQVMCSGEIEQLGMAHNLEVDEKSYYDKTFRKTAMLFASSCKIGAVIAEMPATQVATLEGFGVCLGYAYQIIDDVLDFVADPVQLGKPVGGDLAQGNITLPVILALKDPNWGSRTRKLLEKKRPLEEKMADLVKLLENSGAMAACLQRSEAFLQEGLGRIRQMPPSPARQELENLSLKFLMEYYQQLYCTSLLDGRENHVHA